MAQGARGAGLATVVVVVVTAMTGGCGSQEAAGPSAQPSASPQPSPRTPSSRAPSPTPATTPVPTTPVPTTSATASTPTAVPSSPTATPPATTGPAPGSASSSATACTTAGRVATWSLRRLAAQTVVVPVEETHVDAVSAEVASGVGGVILFGSHAPADLGAQLRRLSAGAPTGVAPVVMSDEEGGSVQRMADLVGAMPSARTMGATMTPRRIRRLAHRVGERMVGAGVTMDLAPVLDLDAGPGPSATDPIGTRSFSLHASVATADGLAFARGLRSAGVVPVVKHFPGLGEATANTDVEEAWTRPWSHLATHGLLPFVAAVDAGMPAVMTSNARVPGLTRAPASLSFAATGRILRHRLGFHGLVVTDSLSGGAIRDAGYDVPRAGVRALRVGADLVLFNAEPDRVAARTRATVDAIVHAARAGTLPRPRLEQAVLHVLAAKHVDLCS